MQEELAEVGEETGRRGRVGSQRVGWIGGLGGIKQDLSREQRSKV